MAICARSWSPTPRKASKPMIRLVPISPATTPRSLRALTASCRVIRAVRRNAKIGVLELRIAATPASTVRSAQAISVKGKTLLRQAWNRNRRHEPESHGSDRPHAHGQSSKMAVAVHLARRSRVMLRRRSKCGVAKPRDGGPIEQSAGTKKGLFPAPAPHLRFFCTARKLRAVLVCPQTQFACQLLTSSS